MRQTADERFAIALARYIASLVRGQVRAPDGKKGMNLSDVELLVGIAVERALQVGEDIDLFHTEDLGDVISVVLHEHPTE